MAEQTLEQALGFIRQRLQPKYTKGETEAFIRIIFRHLMHYEAVDILLHKDSVLPDFISTKIEKVVDELLNDRPIQYIFGETYFHGHVFGVDSSTLIPRPETEELVDWIVDSHPEKDLSVLDAGTGSGCIAISLALALKFAEVTAIDISEGALAKAGENARRLKASVRFEKADILSLSASDGRRYDLIVSNPPYIADSERSAMERNVLDYEPATALFVPDNDALRFYRALARYAKDALKPGGRLYFEINSRFPEEMRQLLKEEGFCDIELRRDMQGLYRFAAGTKGGHNG